MEIILGVFGVIVVVYLIRNKSRNSDPLNRKCAADICHYLVDTDEIDPVEILHIFESHARYQKQAFHVVSMIPTLLMSEGVDGKASMALVPLLQAAALQRPK